MSDLQELYAISIYDSFILTIYNILLLIISEIPKTSEASVPE